MLTINGKPRELPEQMTLTEFLESENYNPLLIAVELNERILPKEEYSETTLREGDVLEIVSFMGGGQR